MYGDCIHADTYGHEKGGNPYQLYLYFLSQLDSIPAGLIITKFNIEKAIITDV